MLRLMQAGSILDVTVSDVPMEKIIDDIYGTRARFYESNADTARVESVTNAVQDKGGEEERT